PGDDVGMPAIERLREIDEVVAQALREVRHRRFGGKTNALVHDTKQRPLQHAARERISGAVVAIPLKEYLLRQASLPALAPQIVERGNREGAHVLDVVQDGKIEIRNAIDENVQIFGVF